MTMKTSLIIAALAISLWISSCVGAGNKPLTYEWPKSSPGELTSISLPGIQAPSPDSCTIRAVDLIGAWVADRAPEKDAFSFTDIDEKLCKGTFESDVLPLFTSANTWYPGAPSCRTCHGPQVEDSYARMDLSTFQGIMAGKGRKSSDSNGEDILGGGNWEASILYEALTKGEMPPKRPAGIDPRGPLVHAGSSQ